MIELKDVPSEIWKELDNSGRKTVTVNYGQKVPYNASTRKLEYRLVEYTDESVTVTDPTTGERKVKHNVTFSTGYMIRGIITEKDIDLYAVMTSGRVILP